MSGAGVVPGCWVFVCGPSGAGKDSVIALARQALQSRGDIVFARRLVTRPAQPGSDHEPATVHDYRLLQHGGALAWHWAAHGCNYGVAMRYAHQVAWGRIVVVNGSREHAARLTSDPLVHRVLVQAPLDQLAARLRQRGRDVPADVDRRLARNQELAPLLADLEIHNDGPPEVAGAALRRYLEALAGPGEQFR